jgi:hypothetical protein
MKQVDKNSLQFWDEFRRDILESTYVPKETEAAKIKRIKRLEENPEEWFIWHFQKYCTAPPAAFHVKATQRLLANDRWYEVRAWSRELAKSARTMMEDMYLVFTGKVKNILIVSSTFDAACRLLKPYKIFLEESQRIRNDYGNQRYMGHWEDSEFTTVAGAAFRAIGAGQSPRGTRNDNFRPDKITIDDFDTDEECRNPNIVDKKWNWIEQALIPTVSVSGSYRFVFNGNIIAKDCAITRAMKKADHVDIINIRDKNGKSSWPEKNSEKDIDDILSKISFNSAQKEYYNNPITEGSVFKEMQWGKCPRMNSLKFIVHYGDPAPSNMENKKNCYKAVIQMGVLNGIFYIYNCRLEHTSNDKFVNWYYELEATATKGVQVYNYLENNSLQDPFYQQVFMPLFQEAGKLNGHYIHVAADDRKKPDKFARIEGNLEPLNRIGKLVFNEDEKNNPHMQRLEEQFKSVDPKLSAPVDGPDAVEGAVYILNRKIMASAPVELGRRNNSSTNKKRF